MIDTKLRQELVEALRVAPFISADESLRRCREAADELERLAKQVETLKAQQREVRPPFYFGEGGKP